jgi:ribosomal protein S27E
MSAKDVSPLLASAQEFITESLRNLNGHRLRFAIVHAITATELVLKERLARLNPALIYRNIDTKSPHREQTVSLAALPQRLANLGMPLNSTQAQLIRDIAEWRHQIVHHMASFDAQVARRQLPQLLDFLARFLRTVLGAPLETFLPTDLYEVAQRLLTDWQEAVVAAQANATQEGNVISDICPRCGGAEVMCLRDDAAVHCHLCGAALYRCDSCDGCGRRTVISYAPHEGSNFCDECIEAAGDAYIQMQVDIARGK